MNLHRFVTFVVFAGLLLYCGSLWSQQTITLPINAKATYLVTSPEDSGAVPATPFALSALGIQPGDSITLIQEGMVDFCVGNPSCDEYVYPNGFAGLFSTNTSVSGAIAVPGAPPIVTPPTSIGDIPTDISQDFFIAPFSASPPGTTVTVPPGAAYLFVIVVDDYYSDNAGKNLAVEIIGGCSNIQLNVQPQLLQDDLPWAPDIYDSTGNTIAQKGCGLTALTMSLQYAGLQSVNHTSLALNPGTLNFFMNAALDYSGSSVDWAPATRDASNGVLKFDTLGGYKMSSIDPKGAQTTLTNALCSQNPYPVIVGVRHCTDQNGSPKFPCHFVLVTGLQTNADGSKKFTIDDPFYPAISLDDYNNDFVTRGQVKDPPGNISELDFSLGDAADLLVTDPTGAQTGVIDATSGADLQGIANSAHLVDSYENDQTGGAPTSSGHFVDIFQPATGGFGVSVIGLKPGTFALKIRGFSLDGSAQPALTIAGISGVASVSAFQVQFSSVVGSTPSAAIIATIQSVLADISNSLALGLIDNAGIANALSSKINAASAAAGTGHSKTAKNILNAFINQVNAQSSKHINGIAPQVLLADGKSLLAQVQ